MAYAALVAGDAPLLRGIRTCFAALNYVSECQRQGDGGRLYRLGITRPVAERLFQLGPIGRHALSTQPVVSERAVGVSLSEPTLVGMLNEARTRHVAGTATTKEGLFNLDITEALLEAMARVDGARILRRWRIDVRTIDSVDEVKRAGRLDAITSSALICGDVSIDEDLLAAHLAASESGTERQDLVRELVARGAPYVMCSKLLQTPERTYKAQRKLWGLNRSAGRPRRLDNDAQQRLRAAYTRCLNRNRTAELEVEDYVEIALRTGLDLREAWPLLRNWQGLAP